jgi:hypothetical protein
MDKFTAAHGQAQNSLPEPSTHPCSGMTRGSSPPSHSMEVALDSARSLSGRRESGASAPAEAPEIAGAEAVPGASAAETSGIGWVEGTGRAAGTGTAPVPSTGLRTQLRLRL